MKPDGNPSEVARSAEDTPTLPTGVSEAQDSKAEDTPTLVVESSGEIGSRSTSGVHSSARKFGNYELLEEIARGGMGVVFKARQTTLNRIVALKMILAGQLSGKEDVQRFRVEAEAAARLDHAGIVPIFEIGQVEDQHYFAMSFVDGQSMAQRMTQGPLPPREAANLIRKVSLAMAYAHGRGVIHRDLKPANVLVDADGQPKVTDFGLAKQTASNSNLTGTGQILGTPAYMPPEQAAGKSDETGPLADVYSLGAMLYALLSGRPPFQAPTPVETLRQVLDRDPVSLTQLVPTTPRDLETICAKCLNKDPGKRYPSAEALAEDLSRYLSDEPIEARPASRFERAAKWAGKQPVVAIILLTLPAWLLGEPKIGVGLLAMLGGFFLPFRFRWLRLLLTFFAVLTVTLPISGFSLFATQLGRDDNNDSIAELMTIVMLTVAAPIGATLYLFLYDCFGWLAEKFRKQLRFSLTLSAATSLVCITGFLFYLRSYSEELSGIAQQLADEIFTLTNLRQSTTMEQTPDVPAEVLSRARMLLWIPVYTGVVWLNLVLGIVLSRAVRRFVYAHYDRPQGASETELPRGIKAVDGDLGRWAAIVAAATIAILPYAAARLVGVYNLDVMTRFARANPLDSLPLLIGATWLAAYGVASLRGFRIAIAASVLALGYYGYQTSEAIETHRRDLGLLSNAELARSSDAILVDRFEGHTGPVKWIEFDSTGTHAVSASGWPEGDQTVRLWDVASAELHWMRRFDSGQAMTAAFTPDGKQVLGGSNDGNVTIWDTETARKITQWYATEELRAILVLPDGERCLVAGRQVRLFELATGQLIQEFTGFEQRRLDLSLSADGKRLASCGFGGDVTVWDFDSGEVVFRFDELASQAESVALNYDGTEVVVGNHSPRDDRRLVVLDVDRGEIKQPLIGHERAVNWVRYSPDHRWIVTAARDQTVRLWDGISGDEIGVLRAHHDWVWSAAFSSNAESLLTGGGGVANEDAGTDFAIRSWDLRHLKR